MQHLLIGWEPGAPLSSLPYALLCVVLLSEEGLQKIQIQKVKCSQLVLETTTMSPKVLLLVRFHFKKFISPNAGK